MNNVAHEQKLIFLETTVQIDRIIGRQEKREKIRRNIDGQRLCTSGHVLAEFNRTLIKDAVTFRNLLLTSPDVGEAVLRLDKYPKNRKFSRTVFLLARLGFVNDKQNTLDRLEFYVERKLHDLFWESMEQEYYSDGVKCAHRQWQAKQEASGAYDINGLRCIKASPPACGVGDFVEMNRNALEQFISAAHAYPRTNVLKAAELLDAILDGTESPFGRNNCYTISDTLIVLEAHSEAEVYSTDGDIHAICEILDKSKYSEVFTDA